MSRKENDNPLKGVRWIWWDLDDTLYAPAGAYRTARWDVFVGCYAKAVGRKDDPATRDQLQQLLDGNQGNLKKTFCDLGLPDTTVQVFIKTFIRRENGAAELDRIRLEFTNLQLIVTLLVMTFLVPCVNAVMVLYKERGGRVATIILGLTTVYALVLGAVVNHGCRLLGITFGG